MKESLFFRFCILYTAGCIICSSLYIYMMVQGVLDVKKEKKCQNNYGLIKVLQYTLTIWLRRAPSGIDLSDGNENTTYFLNQNIRYS